MGSNEVLPAVITLEDKRHDELGEQHAQRIRELLAGPGLRMTTYGFENRYSRATESVCFEVGEYQISIQLSAPKGK